jgi:hypothetical protein
MWKHRRFADRRGLSWADAARPFDARPSGEDAERRGLQRCREEENKKFCLGGKPIVSGEIDDRPNWRSAACQRNWRLERPYAA